MLMTAWEMTQMGCLQQRQPLCLLLLLQQQLKAAAAEAEGLSR
jgi:hypothetical protein